MKIFFLAFLLFSFTFTTNMSTKDLPEGTYALLKTSMGEILCELYPEQAPLTVENFIGLATGTKDWYSLTANKLIKEKPLYSNTIFHRVIPNFMIQGGDPLGNGRGGPGYRFPDEFSSELSHDRAGRLSMANSGPNTNGSQFFITHRATPWLDNRHTIFGQVISGQEIVTKIGFADRDERDMPKEPIILKEIQIINI
jgi:peptidyl-prolyl cis-trans isomerase A (cyclophilin A)